MTFTKMQTRSQSRQQSCSNTPKVSEKVKVAGNKITRFEENKIAEFIKYFKNIHSERTSLTLFDEKLKLTTKYYIKINEDISELYPILRKQRKLSEKNLSDIFMITVYSKLVEFKNVLLDKNNIQDPTEETHNLMVTCMDVLEKTRQKINMIFKEYPILKNNKNNKFITEIAQDIELYNKSYYLRPNKLVNYDYKYENNDIQEESFVDKDDEKDEDYVEEEEEEDEEEEEEEEEIKKVVSSHFNRLRRNVKPVNYSEMEEDDYNN